MELRQRECFVIRSQFFMNTNVTSMTTHVRPRTLYSTISEECYRQADLLPLEPAPVTVYTDLQGNKLPVLGMTKALIRVSSQHRNTWNSKVYAGTFLVCVGPQPTMTLGIDFLSKNSLCPRTHLLVPPFLGRATTDETKATYNPLNIWL